MRGLRRGSYKTVPGEFYGTPKELWGFRSPRSRGRPADIAERFLLANAELLGLADDISGLELQKVIPSLGAHHVIFQQIHFDRRVHRAYVTVHVGNDDRVYLTKNRAMPRELLPIKAEFRLAEEELVRRARCCLRHSRRRVRVQDLEEMWFPRRARLLPVCRVRLERRRPFEEWIVYVNAKTGTVLSKCDNLAAAVRGRARVFQPSPVTAIDGHETLLTEKLRPRRPPNAAYKTVSLWGLTGNGYLEGKRVTTRPTGFRRRVRRTSHQFLFDSTDKGFEETMVYHHIDSAIRYLERLGFRGKRTIFRAPVRVNVNGTRDDDSWYSPWHKLLTFGTGSIDDAEDGETIVHELGHALQDAIIPDFGQSEEAAAMGEGFGDYFAASLFADVKPERYQPCVITWDGLLIGLEDDQDPPCLRRVDNDWTYADFISKDDEHNNGEIWSATLWQVRNGLGGEEADRLIVESHFQQDGFTTFARGARAIIDADQNLNGGANRVALRKIFKDREIGPV